MRKFYKMISMACAALPLFSLSACGAASKTAERTSQKVQASSSSEESEDAFPGC